MLWQTEIDRGDGRDGVYAQALRMLRQFHAVLGVVACHMVDHGEFAVGGFHDIFQNDLPVFYTLVNAFSRRTIDIDALHAFFYKISGQ